MRSMDAERKNTGGHTVVVGASLAGLRGAEALRRAGFAGRLTLVGDEPHRPYDRPPLSKSALTGEVAPEATVLPNLIAAFTCRASTPSNRWLS